MHIHIPGPGSSIWRPLYHRLSAEAYLKHLQGSPYQGEEAGSLGDVFLRSDSVLSTFTLIALPSPRPPAPGPFGGESLLFRGPSAVRQSLGFSADSDPQRGLVPWGKWNGGESALSLV